jgi:hypothetical protein
MRTDDPRAALRGALYRSDGRALVVALSTENWGTALQLAGDGGRIDLRTGEVWPQSAIEYAEETAEEDADEEDPDRWLAVWCEGSEDGYQDMEDFVATVADDEQAERLSIAISGRGAFRRFKDVLSRWPEGLQRWFAFSDERKRGRARSWLIDAGYSPRTPRRSAPAP